MRFLETIKGKKVSLRMCQLEDVNEEYLSWLENPSINQYLETRFCEQNLGSIENYVKTMIDSGNDWLFAIIENETNKHIGNLHLSRNENHNRISLAYFIGNQDYWGKGRPREIIQLGTKYAFEVIKTERIDAGTYEYNRFALKAMLKVGYKKEGYRPSWVCLSDGTRNGVYLVGMTKEDYEVASKSWEEL